MEIKWLGIRNIIGLRVHAIRGYKQRKNAARIPPQYILFDDEKTYIELEEQDYYAYHDCSSGAREIQVKLSADVWQRYMDDENFADATEDL